MPKWILAIHAAACLVIIACGGIYIHAAWQARSEGLAFEKAQHAREQRDHDRSMYQFYCRRIKSGQDEKGNPLNESEKRQYSNSLAELGKKNIEFSCDE